MEIYNYEAGEKAARVMHQQHRSERIHRQQYLAEAKVRGAIIFLEYRGQRVTPEAIRKITKQSVGVVGRALQRLGVGL